MTLVFHDDTALRSIVQSMYYLAKRLHQTLDFSLSLSLLLSMQRETAMKSVRTNDNSTVSDRRRVLMRHYRTSIVSFDCSNSAIRLTGPFVTMVYSMITGDMLTFGLIYMVVLFGFCQSFYFLYKGFPGVKSSLYNSYHSTWMALFQITLGDYNVSLPFRYKSAFYCRGYFNYRLCTARAIISFRHSRRCAYKGRDSLLKICQWIHMYLGMPGKNSRSV